MRSKTEKDENLDIETLKNYCLGLLTEKQEKEVELICKKQPKVAHELQLLRSALEKHTGNKKILFRIDLRKTVWEAIQKIWQKEK